MPFRALGLDASILRAVQDAGYTEPTPIQAAAIPQILGGHDLIGIAQTGTGKTAACVLPILAKLASLSQNGSPRNIRALKDFKSGAVRVLVATDIAARGIDVDGISHVVNFDFPMHPEDYVHRIGRTGRAHAVGDAISFVTPEDYTALRSLERLIGRGIVRKRCEGFDYRATAPAGAKGARPAPPLVSAQGQSRLAMGHSDGGGFGRRHGFRATSVGPGNRWRRRRV